jgi:hypothetical protein
MRQEFLDRGGEILYFKVELSPGGFIEPKGGKICVRAGLEFFVMGLCG